MPDTYEIRKNVPIVDGRGKGRGLAGTIRRMVYGDAIIIPAALQISVHTCARSVGAKVRTRRNDDGNVTVWRIDHTEPPVAFPAAPTTEPMEPAKPFSLDELRDIYAGYAASHSLEQALDILKEFGCGGITEAHSSLAPGVMRYLVSQLSPHSTSPASPASPTRPVNGGIFG